MNGSMQSRQDQVGGEGRSSGGRGRYGIGGVAEVDAHGIEGVAEVDADGIEGVAEVDAHGIEGVAEVDAHGIEGVAEVDDALGGVAEINLRLT